MKDQFYLYYHCIRNTIFPPLFECLPYDDPFDIPIVPQTNYGIDSVIFPVHRWIPKWYHERYISSEIRNIFQIHIKDDH